MDRKEVRVQQITAYRLPMASTTVTANAATVVTANARTVPCLENILLHIEKTNALYRETSRDQREQMIATVITSGSRKPLLARVLELEGQIQQLRQMIMRDMVAHKASLPSLHPSLHPSPPSCISSAECVSSAECKAATAFSVTPVYQGYVSPSLHASADRVDLTHLLDLSGTSLSGGASLPSILP